jgi:hypothetical protein
MTTTEPSALPLIEVPRDGAVEQPLLNHRPKSPYLDLFLISFLILFFELACIRWFALSWGALAAYEPFAKITVDFGSNIGGVILGGLSENLSRIVGFNNLLLVAIGYYVLSALLRPRSGGTT